MFSNNNNLKKIFIFSKNKTKNETDEILAAKKIVANSSYFDSIPSQKQRLFFTFH